MVTPGKQLNRVGDIIGVCSNHVCKRTPRTFPVLTYSQAIIQAFGMPPGLNMHVVIAKHIHLSRFPCPRTLKISYATTVQALGALSSYGVHAVVANVLHTRKDVVYIVTSGGNDAAAAAGR